jgi:hypothetical protein
VTFGALATYFAGRSSFVAPRLKIVDIDDDDDQDVMMLRAGDSGFQANVVSIFSNNGDGTFSTQRDYAVGINPQDFAIGDFDGDGDLDFATVNDHRERDQQGQTLSHATVSVRLNRARS